MENLDKRDPSDERDRKGGLPDSTEVNEGWSSSLDTPDSTDKTSNLHHEISVEETPDSQSIQQSNSTDMEVHHHGHVHEKKKWKEYVFQFFMLFLAVFCGFLAEYQLEHTIENSREKQFMVSLVKDLESDTAQLNYIKGVRLRNLTRIDSALSYIVTHNDSYLPFRQMANIGLGLRSFYQNSGTLDQLKNAGGLRLVRKRSIVDSIAGYDQQVKRMILRDQYETDQRVLLAQTLQKMLDGRTLARMYVDTTLFHKPPPSPETLIKINPDYTGDYLNNLLSCRSGIQNNLLLQEAIKGRAERLIRLIRLEYSIRPES